MGSKQRFEQMLEMLGDMRGLINDIDGTAFGRLDRLFDKIAKETDAIIQIGDELECEIDWEALP